MDKDIWSKETYNCKYSICFVLKTFRHLFFQRTRLIQIDEEQSDSSLNNMVWIMYFFQTLRLNLKNLGFTTIGKYL